MTRHKDEQTGDRQPFEFNMGLSDEERQDLDQMIGEFQQIRDYVQPDLASIQKQIETLNKRVAYLTRMFSVIDRSIKPLNEVIRLSLEKCDILNQRIDAIIDSLRSGEPL